MPGVHGLTLNTQAAQRQTKAMQTLPTQFTKSGFTYAQVQRTAETAIYSQSRHGRVLAYEVIQIQHRPAEIMPDGTAYPEREGFPPSEGWGTTGFTCVTLGDAQARQMALNCRPVFSRSDFSGAVA